MPTLRAIVFLFATVAFQGAPVFADSQSKHPFCIITDNGWTLGISPDGSAMLFRTGNPSLRVSATAGEFDYGKITDAASVARRRFPTAPTRLNYFYGQFDKPKVYPLPESATVYGLLNHAQTIFRDCGNRRLSNLLLKYPIVLNDATKKQ